MGQFCLHSKDRLTGRDLLVGRHRPSAAIYPLKQWQEDRKAMNLNNLSEEELAELKRLLAKAEREEDVESAWYYRPLPPPATSSLAQYRRGLWFFLLSILAIFIVAAGIADRFWRPPGEIADKRAGPDRRASSRAGGRDHRDRRRQGASRHQPVVTVSSVSSLTAAPRTGPKNLRSSFRPSRSRNVRETACGSSVRTLRKSASVAPTQGRQRSTTLARSSPSSRPRERR